MVFLHASASLAAQMISKSSMARPISRSCGTIISPGRLRITVAVGTTIADRPPHRTVRARLRIRLPPWMSGVKTCRRIRVQDAGYRNPAVQNRVKPIPGCPALLTATEKNKPPQPS